MTPALGFSFSLFIFFIERNQFGGSISSSYS